MEPVLKLSYFLMRFNWRWSGIANQTVARIMAPKEGVSLVSVEELTASFSKMHGACQTPTFE